MMHRKFFLAGLVALTTTLTSLGLGAEIADARQKRTLII